MPPSGYSNNDKNAIIEFCTSISNELIKEGKEFNLSPIEALKREINNIDIILNEGDVSSMSIQVLSLTKSLYIDLLDQSPDSYESFRSIRKRLLEKYSLEILDIHVPSINSD